MSAQTFSGPCQTGRDVSELPIIVPPVLVYTPALELWSARASPESEIVTVSQQSSASARRRVGPEVVASGTAAFPGTKVAKKPSRYVATVGGGASDAVPVLVPSRRLLAAVTWQLSMPLAPQMPSSPGLRRLAVTLPQGLPLAERKRTSSPAHLGLASTFTTRNYVVNKHNIT